jgi:N-acetylglucosaminyldiphosphoundecaprenol N-acetyl-beta-D-mannosaminyltransferase
MSKIYLCGVRIDDLTLEEAVSRALSLHNRPCTVFTPNAVMLDACRRDPSLSSLLNRADLSLPDGVGVLSAAAKKGFFFRERVPGIDFGEAILERASKEGLRVFLLGGKEGVARRAAANLSTKYPGLKICGAHSGYFQKTGKENAEVLHIIQNAEPHILFVCFGFPMQEKWILKNLPALPSLHLIAGLGGSLDVWAGTLKRAPKILQKQGLEWAWRMLREPKRLKNLPALVRFSWFS